MFVEKSNFWKIWKIIRGEDVENVPNSIRSLATSEKARAQKIFEETLDQIPHFTDDYRRMKGFFIDWYAAHRAIISVQKEVSDPFILPEEDVDELFKSFGYNHSSILSTLTDDINANKVNFFLDLVNLYKKKGTPQGLVDVLKYYEMGNIDVLEYWLQYDQFNNMVFRGEIVAGSTPPPLQVPIPDIPFELMVSGDPHWIYTKPQLNQLFQANKINFPSKSPYFSIRPRYLINRLESILSVVVRKVQDQYQEWQSTGDIALKDVELSKLGFNVSLAECYLSSIYLFNLTYPTGTQDTNFICYDGTSTVSSEIITRYDELISDPITRDNRTEKLATFMDEFTRPTTSNFLQTQTTAGQKLQLINPNLKQDLDDLLDSSTSRELISAFLRDLSRWIRDNIGAGYPNIAYFILGLDAMLDDLGQVINFFKPYRARLARIDLVNISQNRLTDSIRLDDLFVELVTQEFYDYITADSKSCCPYPTIICPDSTSNISWYSRETYDCGSFYDIGAAFDEYPYGVQVSVESTISDSLICRDATISSDVMVQSAYTLDATANVIFARQSGGFIDFDEEGFFDCPTGNDICQVYVEEI